MSGKILARMSALSLTFVLAACGGDDSSTPLASGPDKNIPTTGGENTSGDNGDNTQTIALELGSGSDSSFQSGQIFLSATNLSAGGTTRLDFNVVDANNGNAVYNAAPTTVTLSSLCSNAKFDSQVTSASGAFSTTYEAGCAGQDTITARLQNGATANATLNVAPPIIGALEFVDVTPDSIALAGNSNSSRPSVSEVTFRLNNNNGQPITTGETISFELSTLVGGITLSQSSTETDENGLAITRLNAGTVPAVVSVTATYTPESGPSIQTTSAPISISATIPDQDSFSISVKDNFLPNARNYDGVPVEITIRAADRNNNRITDSVVNFLTNAGSVQSECTLIDGACSIEWISQNPRSSDGRVLILARTVGEESYTDVDSDGIFTSGQDIFNTAQEDLGEAFLDINQNNAYDSGEEYFDYNNNGQYDAANGIYNGTACVDETNCSSSLLEITQTAKLFMASDNIAINFTTPVAPGEVCVEIAGLFDDAQGTAIAGPPPGGTTVEFTTTNGSIVAPSTFTTSGNYQTGTKTKCVTVEADDTPSDGTFTVKVTPPAPYNGDGFTLQTSISD